MELTSTVADNDESCYAVTGTSNGVGGCKRPRAADAETTGLELTEPPMIVTRNEVTSQLSAQAAECTSMHRASPMSPTVSSDKDSAREGGSGVVAAGQVTEGSSSPASSAKRKEDDREEHTTSPANPSKLRVPTPSSTPTPPLTRLPRKTPLSMSSLITAGGPVTTGSELTQRDGRQVDERDTPVPSAACASPGHSSGNGVVRSPAKVTTLAPVSAQGSTSEDSAKLVTLSEEQHLSLPSTAHSSPASLPPSPLTEPMCVSDAATLARQKQMRRVQNWTEVLYKVMIQDRASHEAAVVKDLCARVAAAIPGDAQAAKDTFLMLLVHLKDPENTALRRRLVEGELPVEVLVTMSEHELVNPRRRQKLEAEFEERARDRNLTEIEKAMQTSSSLFPCPVCKARDCTWTQKQTRSADEPMTVFCHCNKCHHMWKRY